MLLSFQMAVDELGDKAKHVVGGISKAERCFLAPVNDVLASRRRLMADSDDKV